MADRSGPAFPISNEDVAPSGWGLSRREWLAAHAFTSIYADARTGDDYPAIARKAFQMADALITEAEA